MIYTVLAVVYLLVCAGIAVAGRGSKSSVAVWLAAAMVIAQFALFFTR